MRKFAVTLLLDINILLCKKPSLLHSKLERSEFRKLIQEVDREFNKLPKDDVKKSVYVLSDDFKGFIRNPLPTFWSEDLSEAYAGISLNQKKEEKEEKVVLPNRIDNGLKLWFKKQDTKKVLKILSKNSTIDGVLSELGVQCAAGKCYYSFDLKRVGDKYTLPNDRFDLVASIKEFEEMEIAVIVDVESAYPLNKDDVILTMKKSKVEKKKDKIEEFAKKLEL